MQPDRLTLQEKDRCVVTLTFDNFGESYDLLRYGHAGGANADGVYAPRRGVSRILDLLDRHGISATFFMEGWNVRKYAALAREVVERGHEVAAHGWMHEQWNTLDPHREAELIHRTTQTIADVVGEVPRGWRSPAGLATSNTLRLLAEAGYVYDSSFGDDDMPYLLQVQAGSNQTLVELPWQWSLDDALYYSPTRTIRRASEVAELWIEEFDAAIQTTGNFMLVCHPRYSGRPAQLLALEKLISHMQTHEGVRFSRCDAIATEMRGWSSVANVPAPEVFNKEEQS